MVGLRGYSCLVIAVLINIFLLQGFPVSGLPIKGDVAPSVLGVQGQKSLGPRIRGQNAEDGRDALLGLWTGNWFFREIDGKCIPKSRVRPMRLAFYENKRGYFYNFTLPPKKVTVGDDEVYLPRFFGIGEVVSYEDYEMKYIFDGKSFCDHVKVVEKGGKGVLAGYQDVLAVEKCPPRFEIDPVCDGEPGETADTAIDTYVLYERTP